MMYTFNQYQVQNWLAFFAALTWPSQIQHKSQKCYMVSDSLRLISFFDIRYWENLTAQGARRSTKRGTQSWGSWELEGPRREMIGPPRELRLRRLLTMFFFQQYSWKSRDSSENYSAALQSRYVRRWASLNLSNRPHLTSVRSIEHRLALVLLSEKVICGLNIHNLLLF